jgi:hypothetical protein
MRGPTDTAHLNFPRTRGDVDETEGARPGHDPPVLARLSVVVVAPAAAAACFSAMVLSCGGSSGSGALGGSGEHTSSGGLLDLGSDSDGPDPYGGSTDTEGCPGDLSIPDAALNGDGAVACIGIAGGTAGGADPCTPRASLTPVDLASTCESDFAKQCGTTRYEVVCACPEGTCACLGPSTHVVSFSNCPYCPASDAVYALCGFPY